MFIQIILRSISIDLMIVKNVEQTLTIKKGIVAGKSKTKKFPSLFFAWFPFVRKELRQSPNAAAMNESESII